ncbi:sialate O-acetylesterase [Flavivirga aquimarina]|uniref:Sialate O-acetylesterase n=1 Tax=Flavivirga aquimarina TaxID=2027862 RepID=A0ABT8W8I3_9FLAO|nr:sialate O-acetylesterase [Flavivirga aquimarina]MDO5969423.1 sialate O-acetylesterase [Flavivirga aquimarina]
MKKINIVILSISLSLASLFLNVNLCFAVQEKPILKAQTETILQLGPLFKDHMILQRDLQVPVWGKANPNAKITVEFANQKKETTANNEGTWLLYLDALPASFESRTMTVSSSMQKNPLFIFDILIGEVWICSGQSNMQMAVGGVPNIKALIPSAANIRSFSVKRTVSFTETDTCEGEWVTKYPNSAVAFSFAYFLEKYANIPVGIILTAWGSSSLEAWMPRDMTETVPHFKTIMDEFDANIEAQNKIKAIIDGPKPWSRKDDIYLRRQSNILYNAMMHPLIPYACRGVVWYQGERNTQSMFGMLKEPWFSRNSGMLMYGNTLKEWIKNYRKKWNNDNLQFMVIMLPGYGKTLNTSSDKNPESPTAHSWAWMRESQLKALELPNTEVVNTIDLGDVKNIHPKDKLPIGERLTLLATKNSFDNKIGAHGPKMNHIEQNKNTLVVHFDYAKGLKTIDGKSPTGFWLSDDSKKWVKATAKIKGTKIVLHSSELSKPLYVRYAFAGVPKVNLVNEANLPAYPFRTDTFKP